MTTTKTRSQIGKMSRNKGAKAERDVVKYLRAAGFPHAERAVRTGYRTNGRTAADPGDITGTPGIIWSVKDVAVERIDQWLADLDAMHGQDDDVRLLVHKRRGHADPGRWWCWMRLSTLAHLVDDHLSLGASMTHAVPVRMELGHVIPLLHDAGYGTTTLNEVAS